MSNVQIDRRPNGRYVALTRSGTWVDEQAMRNALRALASVPELSEEMRLTQAHYRAALLRIEETRQPSVNWSELPEVERMCENVETNQNPVRPRVSVPEVRQHKHVLP